MVQGVTADLQQVFARAIEPWLAQREPAGGHVARAEQLAPVMLAICQGYIVRDTVSGDLDPATYVSGLRMLLGD